MSIQNQLWYSSINVLFVQDRRMMILFMVIKEDHLWRYPRISWHANRLNHILLEPPLVPLICILNVQLCQCACVRYVLFVLRLSQVDRNKIPRREYTRPSVVHSTFKIDVLNVSCAILKVLLKSTLYSETNLLDLTNCIHYQILCTYVTSIF